MTGEEIASARRELGDLARSLRAQVEWQSACGVAALPPAATPSPQAALPRPESREGGVVMTSGNDAREAPMAAPLVDPLPARASTAETTFTVAEPALPDEARRARLTMLAEKVSTCTACVLAEKRTQTVFARGNPMSDLCFVGEGPGEDEDREGLPFVGKAGQLLDKMISAMGMSESDVYICNIVKCRPPQNRNPLPAEMTACMPYLTEQLDLVRPKVMVTLGNVPLKALFGLEGITKLRGTWRVYKGSVPVMPTYHPAYVLRNPTPQVKGDVWKDLREVLRQLGRPLPSRKS